MTLQRKGKEASINTQKTLEKPHNLEVLSRKGAEQKLNEQEDSFLQYAKEGIWLQTEAIPGLSRNAAHRLDS